MISTSHSFIFIHIPKTGGNSIQDTLRFCSDDELTTTNSHQDGIERFNIKNHAYKKLHKHSPLNDYYHQLGSKVFDYKLFTTIRNPFDKLVSFYFSPHRGQVNWDKVEFSKFVKKVKPLEHFISIKKNILTKPVNSLEHISILKFETLNEDFNYLCNQTSFPIVELSHRNKSSKQLDYRDCYDPELRKWVEKKHKLEISIGNYNFD
jgi:hypothetical protein